MSARTPRSTRRRANRFARRLSASKVSDSSPAIRAVAPGVAAACASKAACASGASPSTAGPRAMATARDRSPASSIATVSSGCSGPRAAASTSRAKWRAIRWSVAASKRSVRYSNVASHPPFVPAIDRLTSNFEVVVSSATGERRRPGSASGAAACCSVNMVCTTGLCPGSRDDCTRSTRRSNGRSWCACASMVVFRTRRRRSTNDTAPATSARSASVFMKKPTRCSVSGRARPATGVPTAKSSCPE